MHEAIAELIKMREKIDAETWRNERGKRNVLTGISLCIERLNILDVRSTRDDERLDESGSTTLC